MRALEFYHKGLKDISLAFYTLCIWVLAVFLRKRNKRILEHIDNLDIKANHRIHSIAGYADSE
jgi:hypothetical protein